ncbi:MAG TPA: hypothetical protein VIY54_01845 [Steroidobacteraceae bacterium]
MLTTYLADIEQMLDEQRWDLALRDAFELPHIAVALADPDLRSSAERCKSWCAQWVEPAESRGSQEEHERICKALCDHLDSGSSTPGSVPSDALRRLRLRRHARNPPRGYPIERLGVQDPKAAKTIEICTAVVEGVRRWYANVACHDATAQGNLARLAVLR